MSLTFCSFPYKVGGFCFTLLLRFCPICSLFNRLTLHPFASVLLRHFKEWKETLVFKMRFFWYQITQVKVVFRYNELFTVIA